MINDETQPISIRLLRWFRRDTWPKFLIKILGIRKSWNGNPGARHKYSNTSWDSFLVRPSISQSGLHVITDFMSDVHWPCKAGPARYPAQYLLGYMELFFCRAQQVELRRRFYWLIEIGRSEKAPPPPFISYYSIKARAFHLRQRVGCHCYFYPQV